MTPLCDQCRKAEATVAMTWQARCETREKRLCDPCARAVATCGPFTVKPLPRPAGKNRPLP